VGRWFDCFQRVISQLGTRKNLQNDTNIMKFGQLMTHIAALAMFLGPKRKWPPKSGGGTGKFEPLQFLTVLSILKPKLKKNQF